MSKSIQVLTALMFVVGCTEQKTLIKDGDDNLTVKNAVVFEDSRFAECVLKARVDRDKPGKRVYADSNADGILSRSEALKVKGLGCRGQGLRSLKGIEQLPNLEWLDCSGNELDVMPAFSQLKNLTHLYCSNNFFSDADCSELARLKAIAKDRAFKGFQIERQKDGRILTCDMVKQIAHVPVNVQGPTKLFYGNTMNDVWGFAHDDSGINKNYVVIGDVTDIYIYEILAEAPHIKLTVRIPRGVDGAKIWEMPNHSTWGEYRYYAKDGQAYLYASTEGNKAHQKTQGKLPELMIINITNIHSPIIVESESIHPGLHSIHNLTLDLDRGLLVAFGGTDHKLAKQVQKDRDAGKIEKDKFVDVSWHGARLYSLNEPAKPKYLQTVGDLYVHDGQVKTVLNAEGEVVSSELYLAQGYLDIHWQNDETRESKNSFAIYDINNVSAVQPEVGAPIQRLQKNYPYGYAHNIWVNETGRFVIITGESSVNNQLSLWEIIKSGPNGESVDARLSDGVNLHGYALAHNAFIKGKHIYVSHYTKGAVVLEIKVDDMDGRIELKPKWSYDTHPSTNTGVMDGSWGIYPFSQREDLFFVTDSSSGFYVFQKSDEFSEQENTEIEN